MIGDQPSDGEVMDGLRASEARYRAIVEHVSDGVFVLDASGRLLEVNETFARAHGYAADELVALGMAAVEPASGGLAADRIERLLAGEALEFEVEHRRRDGSPLPLEVIARVLRDGTTPVIVGFSRDITERRRAAEALRESEYFFRESQAAAFIGSYKTDFVAGRWSSSDVLDEIFGIGRDYDRSVAGWLALVHPDDRATMGRYLAEEVIGRTAPFDMDYRIVRPVDGATRWVSGRGKVAVDDAGVVVSMTGTIQDITERREAETAKTQLEARLLEGQKLEAIGRLAGGVAHDFNNMLTVILGYAEAGLAEAGATGPVGEALVEIRTAAERSADLTRQLLAFARRQVVTPRALDLNTVVEGTLGMLRRLVGEDLVLAWRPGSNLWPVLIDSTQVDQVLANLCVNGRDALESGGTIELETANRTLDEAFCAGHPGSVPGDYVCLLVSDDGSGMDRETLAQLFEPFFTTKLDGRGTGLGLATVYGIVQQNHGLIDVLSTPGHGTTFAIYLPRYAGPLAAVPSGDAATPAARGHETILLVEDEPAILRAIGRHLESRGYAVVTADTPAEAIRLATDTVRPIDLLITDVIMPGMNGRDLADRILALHPASRRLFMSGYTADIIGDDRVMGADMPFIQKPMRLEDLEAKVRGILDGVVPARWR